MTATRPSESAPQDAPALDLISVDWRRIQLLVRVRSTPSAPAPDRLRLRHQSSGAWMPVTGWETEGETVVIRFNVMQGPDQLPLHEGRWQLEVLGSDDGSPGRLAIRTPSPRPEPEPRTFSLHSMDYVVEASFDGDPSVLSLDVRIVPVEHTGRALAADERARGWLWPLRWASVRLFRLMFRVFHAVVRHNGRKILFSSDRQSELSGNLRLVHDRMVQRGLDREYELLTLFKPGIASRRRVADRLRLPWLLARADVIVIDDYQPAIRHLSVDDARIVQLWHAVGAFKTVGYSRVGKTGAPAPHGWVHKNYSNAIVSSHADVAVYAEAFGIPEERVVPTGIPRVDPMFDPAHRAQALDQVRRMFPATEGPFTILFAPTFRGNGARTASYDLARLDYARLHALCVERDAVCLIRMHPFVREPLRIPDHLRDRLIDASNPAVEPNDLLFTVDLLVTDYSSIVFEYSTLGRPMLFYAYDLEDYIASRDFYEPYDTFVPGRIVRTFNELLDAIRREDYELEKVGPFARRHFAHLDGGSTDRVIDLITGR